MGRCFARTEPDHYSPAFANVTRDEVIEVNLFAFVMTATGELA